MAVPNLEKIESLINQIEETSVVDRKIYHDLHAQIINIKGFANEVSKSVEDVQTAMESNELPPQFKQRMVEITTEDLMPCIKFIEIASNKLDESITDLFGQSDL